LPAAWRRKTAVGAAADYFFDVWWRAVGTALAFNTFPVERSGSRRSSGAAAELIEEGWNILVFPEGTRSQDGWMKDFRYGTARLAIAHQIPIVPVSIRGTYNAMPKGRGWPAPGRPRVSVTLGKPLFPIEGEADEPAERLTELLHEALARGLQEDATTWWDSLRSDGTVKAPEGAQWRRTWEASRPLTKPTRVWK
jgi:1-acyl-sn-glycerol-3-phosphate acyltransferase